MGYGAVHPMKATEILHVKEGFGEGFIELVIWQVPRPMPPSEHPFKYRLVYVVDGKRRVGYDNERGKGDHRHLCSREYAYRFVSPTQLMDDFMRDVKGAKK